MQALLPRPLEDADVHAHYARDWVDDGGLRVNFISSADGAASADGKSAGLQTPGDNTVFAALRDLADVVLVGSGTAVTEGYRPIRLCADRAAVRRDFGLPAPLPLAIVSRTLRMDPAADLFTATAPDARTVVLTCGSAPAEQLAAFGDVADVVMCGDEEVEPDRARAALVERGHRRILCEGGPTVFGQFAEAGVASELCLTLSPKLSGPGAQRIVGGPDWKGARSLELIGLLEEDGGLFLRYRLG